jgi:CelD/BcsL family acetyltransferase involved in cellulose biosynthesis
MRLLSPQSASSALFRAAWQDLAKDACEPNPFFEPWFAVPSWQQFAPEGRCLLAAHFDGDRLTGVLPLARSGHYYGHRLPHLSVWLHANAFCGAPLVARGFERAFWLRLFTALDSAPGTALFVHLAGLPATGPLSDALDAVLAETGRPASTVESNNRAMLASGLDAESYLARSMSAKKRKELRRQHKRLSELGDLALDRASGTERVDRWIDEFLALEAAGWKGEAGSALAATEPTRAFFAAALTGAASAGRLERLTLRLDGAPVAMLANFVTPPGIYSFKTAFDERFARYSPGLLLQIENLDLLDRPEIAWADSCAAEGHSMIERIWREKRTLVSRNIAIGGPLRRAAFRALMAYETRDRKAP